MREHSAVGDEILLRMRAACLSLPEAVEEPAWVGTRWRIRTRTFAHVLTIADGWPPSYARHVGSPGPLTLMTFESSGDELHALRSTGFPFFSPPWRPTVVGMIIGDGADWAEIAELITESYCVLASAKLVKLIERPPFDS